MKKSREKPIMSSTIYRVLIGVFCSLLMVACASGYRPMPSEVYNDPDITGFQDLPSQLQNPEIDMLYVTDHKWDDEAGGYTFHRSRALEFGEVRLDLGRDWSWDELIDWTVSGDKGADLPEPEFMGVTRQGQFPETPPVFAEGENGELVHEQNWQLDYLAAAEKLKEQVRRRLQLAPVKEVIVSVHGIQNDLKKTASALGLWWHLSGRQRVPIVYAWPAGKKGLLSFYAYDRESGEFTNFHLKQLLRILAEMPEIEGIHIMGHSRGTDVAVTAVRELILVERAAGRNPRQSLKIKNLILVAADMDFDVVSQRFVAEALWPAFDRVTVYATSRDYALSSAKSLFGSTVRLGQITPEDLGEYFRSAHWKKSNVDVIFYEGGFQGKAISSHSYYLAPAISADMIMVIRGHGPGDKDNRPLEVVDDHLFIIRDDYLN